MSFLAGITVSADTVTPTLRRLQAEARTFRQNSLIHTMVGAAKLLVTSRTMAGVSVVGSPFVPYSTSPYYAPTDAARRPPGVPAPRGGRTRHAVTGRKLKSHVYESGYGEYKAAMGFGSAPNLLLTGLMLGSIISYVDSPTHGMLFFGIDVEERAAAHHFGLGHMPQRAHFDLTPFERTHLVKEAVRRHLRLLSMYGEVA